MIPSHAAYVEALMTRLTAAYNARTPLPLRGAATVRPAIMERPGVLTMGQLQRLYRHIRAEYEL